VIAERAGVSVAWIYRYFENRQAIFDGIVLDAVHRLFETTRAAALVAAEGDWRAGIRAVLDTNVAFFVAEPAFGRLWASEFRSTKMLTANRVHDDDLAAWLYETLTGLRLVHPGPPTERACRLVIALADRGLELAFLHDRGSDPTIVQQLGDALIAILEPFVTDHAIGG
jgi:AcrR family transcriptional regulator